MALALTLPTAAPSQAAIPLPHDDPFYSYDGARPPGRARGGRCSGPAPSAWAFPGAGRGWCRRPSCSTGPRTSRAVPTATVTTVINPTGPVNARTGRLPQLLRRPRRQVLAELHAAGRRPGGGQLRAGLRRDRAGARARGPGVRRDRARLRGPRPALGGRPRVRLEHPRRHPRDRELPRHAAAARRSGCSATPAARSAASGPASSRRRTPPSSTSSAPRSAASRSTSRTTRATSTAATPGPA